MLRRSHKPVVLVVNKVDSFEKYMTDVYEFYNLELVIHILYLQLRCSDSEICLMRL